VFGQLRTQRALDQGLLELLEQPVVAGQVLGLFVAMRRVAEAYNFANVRLIISLDNRR
jgi:hypothetical protein